MKMAVTRELLESFYTGIEFHSVRVYSVQTCVFD